MVMRYLILKKNVNKFIVLIIVSHFQISSGAFLWPQNYGTGPRGVEIRPSEGTRKVLFWRFNSHRLPCYKNSIRLTIKMVNAYSLFKWFFLILRVIFQKFTKIYVFVQTIFLANTSLGRVQITRIYKKGQTFFIVGAENEK